MAPHEGESHVEFDKTVGKGRGGFDEDKDTAQSFRETKKKSRIYGSVFFFKYFDFFFVKFYI
jgi:hypothetical protein